MPTLDDIACKFGTDKSTLARLPPGENGYQSRPPRGHGYTIFYEHYMPEPSRPIRMLEIGVLDGKSLATWNEYYPHALIYGLDIDPTCVRFENERTKVFIGSQADVAVLADICNQVPEGFDVIIDDGSHYVRHVISSFGGLFGHLKPGGLYVIEDLSVARARDWGGTSFNRGMDLERHTGGNDPKEMVGFLKSVREREDVAELVLHLERICFIRKAEGTEDKSRLERGDQLESLLGKTLIQKIVSECRSLLRV